MEKPTRPQAPRIKLGVLGHCQRRMLQDLLRQMLVAAALTLSLPNHILKISALNTRSVNTPSTKARFYS
jgi:hypothetical protein